jgi:signal transduction histidine kinase
MNSDFELTAYAMAAAPGLVGNAVARMMAWNQRLFARPDQEQEDLHSDELQRERARIARELHDTLFQGFLGASMLLDEALRKTPADSPSKLSLSRALHLVHQAIDEGRAALLRPAKTMPSLEQALSEFQNEFTSGSGVQFRILVAGKPKTLSPAIPEQIFLIGREAVVNALRHSGATNIEVEVEYLRNRTRVLVRDNGCGIDPQVVRSGRNSHWGLRGMRERAENVGAQFHIWSRRGAGTEVEISALNDRPITEGHCAAVIQVT